MNVAQRKWPPSSIVLVAFGVVLVGMGLYFIMLRPSLLPEDIRFMSLSAVQLRAVSPGLDAWLTQVFRVMGGYVVATGVLTIALAATSFRIYHWGAAVGALIGGAASIGLMAVVNFMIDSNFKWALLAIALIWACSLGLFWFEKQHQSTSARPEQ
jgi:hypothetical protein